LEVKQLASSVRNVVKAEILDPAEGATRARLKLIISFEGTWSDQGSDREIIYLRAEYEARFLFPEGCTVREAEDFAEASGNLEGVLSQGYIPAHMHFRAQLEMMGVRSTSRPLGWNPNTAVDWEKVENPKRRSRRKSKPKAG
jgi:hypothetical protein